MEILLDTNLLLRRINRHDPQYREARDALNRLRDKGHRLCTTTQNLVEFWVVCTRPRENNGLGLLPADAAKILTRIERLVVRLRDSDELYAEWRHLVVVHFVSGKKAHDTRLVAAMNLHGMSHILTFNVEDFSRYQGIEAVHPADRAGPLA